jgi:Dolichyl-phosphate-mannose-protein mannosyltransferase
LTGEHAQSASMTLPAQDRALGVWARAQASAGRLRIGLWLGGIVLASVVLRLAFAAQTAGPWIFPDELVYSHLARSFAATGHFAVREEPFSAWSFGPLYPILIAPFYRFGTPSSAYGLIKTLNCVLFSLSALPAYFVARRVLRPKTACVLAAGAVFIPSAVYTTKIMTESLAYPLFLFAVLAILRVFEAPSARRQMVVLATIALASLARGQLVVLLPAFACSLVLVAVLDARDTGKFDARVAWRNLAGYRVTWLTLGILFTGFATASSMGLSGKIAGGHGEAFAGVRPSALATSFLYHLVELDLYLGMLPFAATALVCTMAVRRNADRSLRILSVLTGSVTIFLAAAAARYLVAVYPKSSYSAVPVFDRYEFYVVPLFLTVFLMWLERGLPRPSAKSVRWIGVTAGTIPLLLPFGDLLNGRQWGTNSSTVGLIHLGILRTATGSLAAVYGLVVVVGALLTYVFLRSMSARQLLLIVVLNFAVLNMCAQAGNSAISKRALRLGVGPQTASWVDATVGSNASVAALWTGTRKPAWKGWYTIWENEFFNASVRRVYRLRQPMQYALPVSQLQVRDRQLYSLNGRPFVTNYLLTDASFGIIGRRIATDRATGMVLYKVDGPVRLR